MLNNLFSVAMATKSKQIIRISIVTTALLLSRCRTSYKNIGYDVLVGM